MSSILYYMSWFWLDMKHWSWYLGCNNQKREFVYDTGLDEMDISATRQIEWRHDKCYLRLANKQNRSRLLLLLFLTCWSKRNGNNYSWTITCHLLLNMRCLLEQGWGLLSQFPLFRYFPYLSGSWKHMLAIEYHLYVWQVSPQLSCGDTCEM